MFDFFHNSFTDVKQMYALELGYYYSSLFACLFIDHKRSDYKILITHHVITIFLMSFSWLDDFWRMGTFVLMTMDICDVMLVLSKMVNYCGFRKTADVCFGLFVVTWIVFRLVLYPYGALLTSYECKLLIFGIIRVKTIPPACQHMNCTTTWPAFDFMYALIWFLFAIQIFWTYLISKILLFVLKGGNAEDIRSDDED